MTAVLVTARLANEMSGAAPQLDAVLVKARCRMHPTVGAHERYDDCPPLDKLPPIPIEREWLDGWLVHRVSSPILAVADSDRHDRIAQRFPLELAGHLLPKEAGVIATTNGGQKSLYKPVRRQLVAAVSWFAVTIDSPATLRRELKRSVTHIGQDRARGCGRVAEWIVETTDSDRSWFAPHPDGLVLMRQLPFSDSLPAGLVGFTRDFDAVCPPYWHPGRKTEIVRPC